jgi:ABC-type multidrug transport system ATPase subunit
MNIMSGLFNGDRGDIIINGKSVKYNIDIIRSSLGVCPQHDILWYFS